MMDYFFRGFIGGAVVTILIAATYYNASSSDMTFKERWPVGLRMHDAKPGECVYSDFKRGWSWRPCIKLDVSLDMMCKFGHLSWMDPEKCKGDRI